MLAKYAQLCRTLQQLPSSLRCLVVAVVIAALSLLANYGLYAQGFYYESELALVQFFASHPFYMTAEEAQNSMLSADATLGICVAISCYFSIILLREQRLMVQVGVLILSLIVMLLASCCAVFWGGILNMSAPATCLLFCFILTQLAQQIIKFNRFLINKA